MRTADPKGLAAYRAELIDAGLPESLADRVVLSAADAAHRQADTLESYGWADEEMSPADVASAAQALRVRRAAELAEVG